MTTHLKYEWPSVRLGDVGEFRNGVNYSKANFGKGVKVIGVSDFQDNVKASFDELEEINPAGVVRKEHYLKDGDILFVRSNGNRDLIGRSMFVENPPEEVTHSAFSIRLRFVDKKCLPRFYAYVLRSSLFRQSLSLHGGGTNISNLNQDILGRLQVPLPPNPVQHQIASILSAYDDLIENNTRRIRVLEQMAQILYRQWFVKFRFPGHEKVRMMESELGPIPEGWTVRNVEAAVKRVPSGEKFDQKTVAKRGLVPVLDQGKSGIIGYHNEAPGVEASPDDPIIVFANHTCYQRLVMFPFSAIQNVLPFRSSDEFSRDIYWLHWATKDLVKFNDYKGHWPEFMSKRLIIPLPTICSEFGKTIKLFMHAAYILERKNDNLRETRDLLLPKLVSGEVSVEQVEAEVPAQTV